MISSLSILTNILRIVLENVVIFLLTTVLVFAIIRSIPGDDITAHLPLDTPQSIIDEMRKAHGLDRPFIVQYAHRLYATLTLDLGVSQGRQNSERVAYGTVVTISLTAGAGLFLLLIALPLGIFSGLYPENWWWKNLNFAIYLISMVPIFLLAYATFFLWPYPPILADREDIIRLGLSSLPSWVLFILMFLTMISVLAIGDGIITELIRAVREEVGRIVESEFIRAVRANGGAVWKHVAKNLFVPIATVFNLRIVYLLGGAVVVEAIYTFPGLGLLTVEAVDQRSYNLVFSITVVSVLIVLLMSTINKILITLIDPRARN